MLIVTTPSLYNAYLVYTVSTTTAPSSHVPQLGIEFAPAALSIPSMSPKKMYTDESRVASSESTLTSDSMYDNPNEYLHPLAADKEKSCDKHFLIGHEHLPSRKSGAEQRKWERNLSLHALAYIL